MTRFRLLFVLTIFVASVLSAQTVGANPNFGPDPDDVRENGGTYGDGQIVGYAVAKANYIDLPENNLKIYSKSQNIAIFVLAGDLCVGQEVISGVRDNYHAASDVPTGGADDIPMGDVITNYTANGLTTGGAAMSVDTNTGIKRSSAGCLTARAAAPNFPSPGDTTAINASLPSTTKILLTSSNKVLSGSGDIYEYDFQALRTNPRCNNNTRCFFNSFRVVVLSYDPTTRTYGSGANTWVSQNTNRRADEFAINPGATGAGFFDYRVKFAPDCTITAQTQPGQIVVYDDDNLNQPGVQATATPFRVQVVRQLRSAPASAWVGIPLTAKSTAWNNNNQQANETDGNANNGPGNANKRYYLDVSGGRVVSDYIYVVGTDSSKQRITLDFTVDANYIYQFHIIRIDRANNIQYQMPYPSVWGDTANRCQLPLRAVVTMPATAIIGSTVNPVYTVANDINQATPYDATFSYTRRLWIENGAANSGFDPASGDIEISPPSPLSGSSVSNNGANVTLNPAWSKLVDRNYKYICASLHIDATADNSARFADPTHHDAAACTAILKSPSFGVTSGDVRTGGSFVAGCTIDPRTTYLASDDGRRNYYGVISHDYTLPDALTPRHSFVTHGLFPTGYARNMASNRVGPGGINDQTLSFAWRSGSTNAGYFYGDYINPTLLNPLTTHCMSPVFTAGRYPASTTTSNIASGATEDRTVANGSTTYNFTGSGSTLRINAAGPIAPGQRIIVRVTQPAGATGNKVEIQSNIAFAGTAAHIGVVPQFVLLVGNADGTGGDIPIIVADAVTRLDGIYANRGTGAGAVFSTCKTYADTRTVTTANCNQQLQINGSVIIGGRIDPYRTYGHETAVEKNPGESFGLRSDISLGDTTDNGPLDVRVLDQREVAPRL